MKILVIAPSWIGDMMMSQSLYCLLAHLYSNSQIDVMTTKWNFPLLKYMSEVNKALIVPFEHGVLSLKERWRIGKKIQKKKYERALVLPNSFKSALIPFFARIPKRTGWLGEMRYGLLNDIRILNKKQIPLMVKRYAILAYECHMFEKFFDLPDSFFQPKLILNLKKTRLIKKIFIHDNTRLIIGFCFSAAFGLIKCWPYYHYATLAKLLINRYYQVILFGSVMDYTISLKICSLLSSDESKYCYNLTGKTTLDQAINLISCCDGIVSNDTGLMHIASALNRPLIVLYGPSNSNVTPPLSDQAKIIRSKLYYEIKKDDNKQDYHKSLIDIHPLQVLKSLEKLLFKIKKNACFNC